MLLLLAATCVVSFAGVAGAQGWEPGVTISQSPGSWYYPQVANYENHVHVVWRDAAASTLQYRRSLNGGTNWEPILNLGIGTVHEPRIAVSDNGVVHVIWRGSSSTIQYRRSTTAGDSFEPAVAISTGADDGFDADIAASGTMVHVVWIQNGPSYDIRYRRSTTSGSTWMASTLATSDGGATEEEHPRVAASGSFVHLAWIVDSGGSTTGRYKRSADGGANWIPPTVGMFSQPIGTFDTVALATGGSSVFISRDGPGGPWQRTSLDNGNIWNNAFSTGSGAEDRVELAAGLPYVNHGMNTYMRGTSVYVTDEFGAEVLVGTASGSSARADGAVGAAESRHIVANSLSGDYEIVYWRYTTLTQMIFKRGDFNIDNTFDIADPIAALDYLFSDGPAPLCEDAADANDDGAIDVGDPIRMLDTLFSGAPPLPLPYPDCGIDPTPDGLDCEVYVCGGIK